MKRNFTKIFIILALIGLFVYCYTTVYLTEFHFRIVFSNPEGLITKITSWHYKSKGVTVRTPLAVDAKGRIYIVGKKKDKAYILVVGEKGTVDQIVIPRWRNGEFLQSISHISVSAQGEYIWTLGRVRGKEIVHRICVHNSNGNAIEEWLVRGHSAGHWLLDASRDGRSAYVMCGIEAICLRFIIGHKQPQVFQLPTNQEGAPVLGYFPTSFHYGKYWIICPMDKITKQIQTFQQAVQVYRNKENYLGVVTWTPKEGFHLVTKFRDPIPYSFKVMSIQWIDETGNLYISLYDWSLHPIVNLFSEIKVLKRLFAILNISIRRNEPNKVLIVFSSKGDLLDKIVLSSVIQPIGGEKLEYGQLVKVDETGIYLEVERVSEPREYRIVRIVKKPRWQVWLESLTKRTGR